MIRHQEAGAKRADDLDLVADLEIAHVVGGDALDRFTVIVFQHALDRQREIVEPGALAVADRGD